MMQKIKIVILALLLLPSIGYAQKKTNEEGSDTMVHEYNNEALEIIADGIRAKMSGVIFEEFQQLIKKQVAPWIFYNSKGVHIKEFGGEDISMSGSIYNDSSKNVFFGHIEPFIEDAIKRRIEETIEFAKDKNVPLSAVLGSTEANLSGGIDTVYHKMREIDRRLRGGGYPESVPKRDVSIEIKKMNNFLDRQMKIAKNLHFEIPEASKKKPFYKKLWFYITSALAFLLLVSSLILNVHTIKEKYSPKDIPEKGRPTHDKTMNANIFADVSKDGTISRSNEFPWKIRKSKNEEGNVLYTMVDRRGDKTAISVVPDYPKPEIYQSYGGMVIKYTCAEKEIPDFTIKVKY